MHSLAPTVRRRRFLGQALGAAATLGAPLAGRAQGRPIRLVVAFGTGSANDLIARELAVHMSTMLEQSVFVENRLGGGGVIGTDAVAKAAPDGYTIGLGTSSQLVANVGLYKTLPFDVEKDLAFVGLVSRTPLALVASPKAPATLKDLIAYGKAHPKELTYGSGGAGSISHILGEAFGRAAGIELQHVPYKGNGAALVDLAGSHIDLLIDALISAVPMVEQGRARLLGVPGSSRLARSPTTPTFAEGGLPSYESYTWNCLFAPGRTPREVVDRLNAALNKALLQSGHEGAAGPGRIGVARPHDVRRSRGFRAEGAGALGAVRARPQHPARVAPRHRPATIEGMNSAYVLTLSCPDRTGIVHAVSGFLLERGGNIEEAAQYNDHATGLFFMRVQFACERLGQPQLRTELAAFAETFAMRWSLHSSAEPVRTVLMVSKEGHCLNDLLFRWKSGLLPLDIRAIISNHRDFYQLAASYNVPFHHIPVTAATKAQAEARAYEVIQGEEAGAGGAGALHADPLRRPVPQAGRACHQHPPLVPAQLQGRQALLPGA